MKESKKRHMHQIKLGTTTIGDIIRKEKFLGFLDYTNKTIYVSQKNTERVKKVFKVHDVEDNFWNIDHHIIGGKYNVESEEKLNHKHILHEKDTIANKDEICDVMEVDECANFYDDQPGDKFIYSWKNTSGGQVYFCYWGEEDCGSVIEKTNNVTLYPEEDCKGTPYQSDEAWEYCILN